MTGFHFKHATNHAMGENDAYRLFCCPAMTGNGRRCSEMDDRVLEISDADGVKEERGTAELVHYKILEAKWSGASIELLS